MHVVVHDYAALDFEPSFLAESDIGANAGGDYDQIRRDAAAAFEFDPLHVSVPQNLSSAESQQHRNSHLVHFGGEITAARRIKLALHQRFYQVDDSYVAALNLQTTRGFEAEQPAADHNSFQSGPGTVQQSTRVVKISKDENAVFFNFFDRRNKRITAGGQEKLVESGDAAVVAGHSSGHGIHVDDANAQPQIDAILFIPIEPVQNDVMNGFLSGEH